MNLDAFATTLAEKLTPLTRATLVEEREAIIADAGGLPRRAAVRLAFPMLLNIVPHLLRVAIKVVLREVARLNLDDLLGLLKECRAEVDDPPPVA